MRVFVAGASGAIGRVLVGQLVAAGHTVVGMARSDVEAQPLRALGAEPVGADALDAAAVDHAVRGAAYARWLGAPEPPQVSEGEVDDLDARYYAMQLRGASNIKARRELEFRPRRLEWLGDGK